MKNPCCIVLLSLIVFTSYGQYNYYQTEYTFQNRPTGLMTQLAPAPKEKINSVYLYNEFTTADIFYKDSTKTADASVKLDLMQNVIDIQFRNEVRMLPVNNVQALLLKRTNGVNELYVNSSSLPGYSKNQKEQLYQVLSHDVVSLYGKSISTIIEASTNPALGLSNEPEIVIKKRYLITYKGNLIEIDSKSKLKEDAIRIFGAEVEPYLKKVNPKSEADLLLLVGKLSDLKEQAGEHKGVVN